jgi:Xaa-Pro aminopeptidase
MFSKFTYFFLSFILINSSFSQTEEIDLPNSFFKNNRDELRSNLPEKSFVILFSNPVRNRSNDVNFYYHQDPNFYYLTGYKEPNSALIITSEKILINGELTNEVIYVQPKDKVEEMWNGRRLGVEGSKQKLGIETVYSNIDFKDLNLSFESFNKVCFTNDLFIKTDFSVTDGDLNDLKQHFKNLINKSVSGLYNGTETKVNNTILENALSKMRRVKKPIEIDLIKRAVDVSVQGQIEVMKYIKPGVSELEIQGLHEFVYKNYSCQHVGYGSIVGHGHNGCFLHYTKSSKKNLSDKLVLMDLGAEYKGYTADVTRTVPINGKFSEEEKIIYNIVLEAQQRAISSVKPGVKFWAPHFIAQDYMAKELKKLGIIAKEKGISTFFPHGSSHFLGLDVHDVGNQDILKENMVLTVEPGLYFPENSNCDKKWWGIAIRIEDDILVTKNGFENLSKNAPREIREIEKLMEQSSHIDDFKLPKL